MNLGKLIEALEAMPQSAVIKHGFGLPMSYRGYYEDVAFPPMENQLVSDMLLRARSALGHVFEGYKGGDYLMEEYTTCWISEYGEASGDGIGDTLVRYWQEETAAR